MTRTPRIPARAARPPRRVPQQDDVFRGQGPSLAAVRENLPKLSRDLAWAHTAQRSINGKISYLFRAVRRRDFARLDRTAVLESSEQPNAATRRTIVYSSKQLPPAPSGKEWRLLNIFNLSPAKYEYGLVSS